MRILNLKLSLQLELKLIMSLRELMIRIKSRLDRNDRILTEDKDPFDTIRKTDRLERWKGSEAKNHSHVQKRMSIQNKALLC